MSEFEKSWMFGLLIMLKLVLLVALFGASIFIAVDAGRREKVLREDTKRMQKLERQ